MYQPYPKYVFYSDGRAVIVHDEAEHAALPEGWAETPAAFPPFAPEPEPARHDAVTVSTPEPAEPEPATAKKAKKAK